MGIIGKKEIQSAYFEQFGQMKLRPDQIVWSPAKVEQYVTIDSPGFLWKVNMKMNSFLNVVGRDLFQQGKAAMTIKIASLLPVKPLYYMGRSRPKRGKGKDELSAR